MTSADALPPSVENLVALGCNSREKYSLNSTVIAAIVGAAVYHQSRVIYRCVSHQQIEIRHGVTGFCIGKHFPLVPETQEIQRLQTSARLHSLHLPWTTDKSNSDSPYLLRGGRTELWLRFGDTLEYHVLDISSASDHPLRHQVTSPNFVPNFVKTNVLT